MAIKDVGSVNVRELLAQPLRIPDYQRPYSWAPETALQLVDDVMDAANVGRSGVPYVLGAVILHARTSDEFDVVDGQQRLLTLRMILAILRSDDLFGRVDARASRAPVIQVWAALAQRLRPLVDKAALCAFVEERCQLVRIVTDDVDEAFRVFDSQNYRGKALAPHDLLKAHHLREMQGESPAAKVAIVEAWEAVKDKDLDELFSTFLFRIARWSRGESALEFTVRDIGMFKGISAKSSRTLPPHARYHAAAQAALPLLDALAMRPGDDVREARRSRFQLDVPFMAGRHFFEMVTFMQQELSTLKQEAGSVFAAFDARQHRYRYVHELFLAALLYYTNKFGSEGLGEVQKRLFKWAYAIRLERLRVQFVSADNRARGKEDASPSPFVLLRNAMNGDVVRALSTECRQHNADHEKKLASFINTL